MERYQVILAYDGTDFCGFQRQTGKADSRTVQSTFETALQTLGWQGHSLLAAGRTDTGVHASGQVVAFDLEWKHSLEALQAALNANLPRDVAVRSVALAAPGFHPRYDAIARRYQYRILPQPVRDPLGERFAWRVWPAPLLSRLGEVASLLPGTYDFAAFGTSPRPAGSTFRSVIRADWWEQGADMVFEIIANAFLYRMVRRLVSFQVRVGQGEVEPGVLLQLLEGGVRLPVKGLAPPQGLTLVEVIYSPLALAGE
jgi:tRNA pseudouridine38-40 synthase